MGDRRLVRDGARLLAAALFVVMVCGTSTAFAATPLKSVAVAGNGTKRAAPARGGFGTATDGIGWNIPGTWWGFAGVSDSRTGNLSIDLAERYYEDDVYAVYLAAGEIVTISLNGDSGTDFGLWLYGPEALDVVTDDPLVRVDPAAWGGPDTYPMVVQSYTVPKSGYYYIDAFSFVDSAEDGGANSGSGGYTLGITVERSTTGILLDSVPTLAYRQPCTISGEIHSRTGAVAGTVKLMASEDGVYYDPMLETSSLNGAFSFAVPANTKRMYYLVQYAGTSEYNPSARPITVNMLARISGPSGVRYGTRSYTLKGSLGSWHNSGSSAVRIYLWRYVSGHWKAYGYRTAKMSSYGLWSPYTVKYKFPYAGKWKMQAYHSDSSHATTRSSYTYLTVK